MEGLKINPSVLPRWHFNPRIFWGEGVIITLYNCYVGLLLHLSRQDALPVSGSHHLSRDPVLVSVKPVRWLSMPAR